MEMDLDSMKYSDLQALAKTLGLKANMKADKMLKALKQHFEQKETSDNGNTVTSDDVQIQEEVGSEPKSTNDALVTTRRGKKQQAKRKYLGDGANPSPIQEESRVQEDAKSPGEKEEEGEGKRSSKRRKVSSAKDTETPASEMKPGCDEALTEASNDDVVKKKAGKIPRHEGLMKKAALKPTTPNFKKLHEAHFNKMESIDSYVQRRNKQKEVLRNSVKDPKAQSENRVKIPADTKTRAKPLISHSSLFSPGVPETKDSRAPAGKPVKKDGVPFRPSVLSGNKINVRFSQTTQDNEHKRSLVKTPSRMSLRIPLTPTPGRKIEVHANKDSAPVNRTPGLTPFIFSGASGTPATNKKSTFDLKASLSRPLTYKPHTGKLKPYGATRENAALNKSQTLPSHQKNYKQHRVQTRDERRVHHNEDRKQKKEKMLGARRGLVLA